MTKARDIASATTPNANAALLATFPHRNLIINGAMQVAQRGTSVASSDGSNEGFVALDRWSWRWNNNMSGQATLSQATDAPAGFANSWKAAVTTANGTMRSGTSDWCYLYQPIEAQNLQHLNYGTSDAKTITLSFYAKRVGTWGPISVGLQTQDGTQEFINSSIELNTTWTRHTVTFVGSTTATINNDNGYGMGVFFSVAGSQTGSFTGAASSSWSTTRQDFDNQIGNFLANTSNEFYITGVQLEVGETATPFEHRSFGDELQSCRRYFIRYYGNDSPSYPRWFNPAYTSGSYMGGSFSFPVQMRATPSLTAAVTYQNAGNFGTGSVSREGMILYVLSNSTTVISGAYINNNSSDHITLDAEL